MKPPVFEYFAPDTIEESLSLLSEYGDDARPLAGGQSLVPMMNMRIVHPAVLVDLNRVVGLNRISINDETLILETMVRQSEAEMHEDVRNHCPLLTKTLRYVGVPAVKNRGTVGGSLAHADPVAELPGVAMVLGAEFVVESNVGRRTIKSADFYVTELTTSLEAGEMLREIHFPKTNPKSRSAFVESGNRKEGPAIAGVACSIMLNEKSELEEVNLAAIGVAPVAVRLTSAENVLLGQIPDNEVISEAANAAVVDIDPWEDIHATAHYRKRLTSALVAKAIIEARES